MLADVFLNTNTYGKLSDSADTLVIELSDNVIQFGELKSTLNQALYLVNYPVESAIEMSLTEHLMNAVKHFQFSKKQYQHVFVNYATKQFTLCPSNFYSADAARAILEFNVGDVSNQVILIDEVNSEVKLIYAIDEQLKSVLDRLYPQHQVKHSLTLLIKLMMSAEEFVKENILLSVHSDYVEFVVKRDNKFILANQFTIKTQEDILYYLLFVLEQYQFNPLFVAVSVLGNVNADSSLIQSLKKYVKNVRLAKGHKSLNWSEVQGMPQHFYYTLVNRLFCE